MVTEESKPKKKTGFQKTLEFLKKYEGFRDTVYLDGNGIPTIGYGFTDPALIKKGKITRAEADRRLEQEIRTREKELRGKIKGWENLADDSKTALLSYYFNYPKGFKDTTRFMQNWNAGNHYAAIKEIDAGINDKNNPGLRKRRLAEQALLNADPYFGIIKKQTPDGINIVNMPDGNKVMKISPRMYERPQYEPEFKLYHDPKTVYLLNPAAREVPESLDAWNGADSPSKGPRMPSLTKQLDDLQRDNPLNGGFKPETIIYGRRRLSPLSLKLPSLDQMLDLGSPQQQMTQYFADALQVPRMHLDIAPLQTFKNGKLPKYGDGSDGLLEKYDQFVEDDPYYAATVLSFLPFIGTAMDIREAVKNPTAENVGYAALSGLTDLVGGRIFSKIAGKTIRAKKAAKAARKANYEYWKDTPFIQNMPKEQSKRTLKFYADRAADEARQQIIDDPTFQIDGFNIAAGLGAYVPDFVANMNQHRK